MAKGKYEEWLTEEGLLKLEAWARDGLTLEDIAHNMGVALSTLHEWKKAYPEISEALKIGREVADIRVENALYRRATGYTTTEVRKEYEWEKLARRIETTKEIPPDVGAACMWLKNRRPDRWRDRPENPGDSEALIKAKELLGGVHSAID